MNTTEQEWAAARRSDELSSRGFTPVSLCGQDLDVWVGNHCPRCGTTLAHAPSFHLAA